MPKSDGPIKTPAIISPTTCGWPSRRDNDPTRRQTSKMKNICKKKTADNCWLVMGQRVEPDPENPRPGRIPQAKTGKNEQQT